MRFRQGRAQDFGGEGAQLTSWDGRGPRGDETLRGVRRCGWILTRMGRFSQNEA